MICNREDTCHQRLCKTGRICNISGVKSSYRLEELEQSNMASDKPCFQNNCGDWRRKIKERRRKCCTERLSQLTKSDWEEEDVGEIINKEDDLYEEDNRIEVGENVDKGQDGIIEQTDEDLEKSLDKEEDRDLIEGNKREAVDEHDLTFVGDDEVYEWENKTENVRTEDDWGDNVERKLEEKYKEDMEKTEEDEVFVHVVDDDKEEHPAQNGTHHLREEIHRIQAENIHQWKESIEQEDIRRGKEENLSGSVEIVDREDSRSSNKAENQHEDSIEREDPLWQNDCCGFQSRIVGDRVDNDGCGILIGDERTVPKSLATQKVFDENPQEKEFSDHEEVYCTMVDDGDDDEVKTFCTDDDHPTRVFLALNKFRDSSTLTDLTLNTVDGRSLCVHSLVLAAVSSLIWKNMNMKTDSRVDLRRDTGRSAGDHTWLLSLGPEVDYVGLEAIVEFAYTGLISCLNEHMDQIKAAAQALGAPRVLDFCACKKELPIKAGGHGMDEKISAAQQIMTSLQSIKQLWINRAGCDVVLQALGGSLHVHRVILAVSSDYFRGMFTLGMKESFQASVSLPFLLASDLEVLIGSSYSGSLPLSWTSIFEITGAAIQLQYQPALTLCLNFLQQEMTPHTCLDVVAFAEAYGMAHLLEAAEDFVLRQFQKVACTLKFKDLSGRQLLKYLNSCSLCVPSELVVFNAVVAWIQAESNVRQMLAKELMKTVHFPLMTFEEFKEVQSQDMWHDHSLAGLYEKILEEFCSTQTALQNQCRIYLPKENLVLIGGDQISEDLGGRSISRQLWFGNSLRSFTGIQKAIEWRSLGTMPEPARFGHEVAVLNEQLYVFGGKKYYGNGDTLNSTYRYDPLQDSWESLSEMQEKRCSFSVVVLDQKLYAIGGQCERDHLDSVELYCPTTDSWSFTWPLDLPLSGHVAKILKGQIFISGGQSSDFLCLSSMFLYHPDTGSTLLANMNSARAHHCMETLGDCLYVAGGITTDHSMTVISQLACEVYCPATDSWTAFTSLLVPHVGAGSAVLEGKFYLLGGYSQEDCSDTNMVHRYNPVTQKWENVGEMPGPNNDLQACVLCVPQHLRM